MNKKYLLLIFVIILFLPLFDLFHSGLPITHDGQDHVARIANFYQSLQDGNIIPRWAGNLNWGYGHPILMFLYPLPSYLASLFHFLGFTFVDSTKLVFGLAFIVSGLTMYLWLRAFLSYYAAFLGSLLYTFAPYRFVDLYVRGAIGEHVAFIFPPLVLYFLYKLSKKLTYSSFVGGVFSLAGLILAHNAISLMFIPIILFYSIFLGFYSKNKKAFILHALYIIFLGFSLAAFFWLPAYLEGKYTLRDIVTKGITADRFVTLKALFYGPWNYGLSGQFTVQAGIVNWLAVVLSLPVGLLFYKKRNQYWIIISTFIIFFILTSFLMLSSAKPIWEVLTILQKFQFPWRFLSLSVFLSATLGAFVLSYFAERKQRIILFITIIAVVFFNKSYWQAKDYQYKPENYYSGIYNGTTDTGESAPIWSVRFMEHKAKAPIEVIKGRATIQEQTRSSTKHVYRVNALEQVNLQENTLYFPGWKVTVDGKSVPIEFQDQNSRGLMTFFVEKGEHTVEVLFRETRLRQVSDSISLISLFVLGIFGILKRKIWQN